MKQYIKKILPIYIVYILKLFKQKVLVENQKKLFAFKMQKKHQVLVKQKKDKKKIKVIFLALVESVWKVDSIFKKMLDDPYFEPIILVCPYIVYGKSRMKIEIESTCQFFQNKGYPTINAYNKTTNKWINLDQLEPDILFFTIPHKSTISKYYEDAYSKYLSCYVPYFYLLTFHGKEQSLYNNMFHNAMWKIFLPHEFSLQRTKEIASNRGINAIVTGYPSCENLFDKVIENKDTWKIQDKDKKKVIWAPHHSIDGLDEFNLSTFLIYADYFKEISIRNKNEIQWAFKPHPSLKSKLYRNIKWGKDKTDKFYNYWKNAPYSQLEEGKYDDLFLQSDAMIHDSGSFLVEYLYTKKPVMYLMNTKTKNNLNEFGLNALDFCQQGHTKKEIDVFIAQLVNSKLNNKKALNTNKLFYEKNIASFFNDTYPSDRILDLIKMNL
jgi:hypothetical protein